jgi:DNA-binding response OmpR family regulator
LREGLNLTPRTVLMIDDEPEHLKMHSWFLNEAGFRVVTVVVGRNSFSLPDQERPGLIFIDYRLNSELSSAQVVRLLRQTFAGVPIILSSSADAMPPEMSTLVDGFISKADPEKLAGFAKKFFSGDGQAGRARPSMQ